MSIFNFHHKDGRPLDSQTQPAEPLKPSEDSKPITDDKNSSGPSEDPIPQSSEDQTSISSASQPSEESSFKTSKNFDSFADPDDTDRSDFSESPDSEWSSEEMKRITEAYRTESSYTWTFPDPTGTPTEKPDENLVRSSNEETSDPLGTKSSEDLENSIPDGNNHPESETEQSSESSENPSVQENSNVQPENSEESEKPSPKSPENTYSDETTSPTSEHPGTPTKESEDPSGESPDESETNPSNQSSEAPDVDTNTDPAIESEEGPKDETQDSFSSSEPRKEDNYLIKVLPLSKLRPSRLNEGVSEDDIDTLKESIRNIGLTDDLIVSDKGDHYEILAGHRRFKALTQLVAEGDTRFEQIECKVANLDSIDLPVSDELKEKYIHATTNTEARKMSTQDQLIFQKSLEEVYQALREQGVDVGSKMEFIAEKSGLSRRTISQNNGIQKKTNPKLMEYFQIHGEPSKAQMERISLFGKGKQTRLLKQLQEEQPSGEDITKQFLDRFEHPGKSKKKVSEEEAKPDSPAAQSTTEVPAESQENSRPRIGSSEPVSNKAEEEFKEPVNVSDAPEADFPEAQEMTPSETKTTAIEATDDLSKESTKVSQDSEKSSSTVPAEEKTDLESTSETSSESPNPTDEFIEPSEESTPKLKKEDLTQTDETQKDLIPQFIQDVQTLLDTYETMKAEDRILFDANLPEDQKQLQRQLDHIKNELQTLNQN